MPLERLSCDVWTQILRYLEGSDLMELSLVSPSLCHLMSYPPMVASFIASRFHKHLGFVFLLYKRPEIVTPTLIDAMLKEGAPLPKHLIERLYKSQQFSRFQNDAVEYLVAQGYRLYGDKLNLGLESDPNDTVDDYTLFLSAFHGGVVNTELLKTLYNDHGFNLATVFESIQDEASTQHIHESVWLNLYRCYQLNPRLALKYIATAHLDLQCAKSQFMAAALVDEITNADLLTSLLEQGFPLDGASVAHVLSSSLSRFDDLYGLLQETLDAPHSHARSIPTFKSLMKDTLQQLFLCANLRSTNVIDAILSRHLLDEADVRNALYVDAFAKDHSGSLLFMTKFGAMYSGMTDCLWQLMLCRYSVQHEFTKACFSDLLVGGHVEPFEENVPSMTNSSASTSLSNSVESLQQASTSHSKNSLGSTVSALTGLFTSVQVHEEKKSSPSSDQDQIAMDAMETLFIVGQPFSPSILGVLSRTIHQLLNIPSRIIYFMAQVEKSILNGNDPKKCDEWKEALTQYILDDEIWIESVTRLHASSSSNWFSSLKMTTQMGQSQSMVRFYQCGMQLVDQLQRAKRTRPVSFTLDEPDSSLMEMQNISLDTVEIAVIGPFEMWLNEIRKPVRQPVLSRVDSLPKKEVEAQGSWSQWLIR